eukprot:TRINITY_DN325_c0_g1_i15.p3 TRINITY_DN325_c0_g1~~TRINITY_DN325_c0_g1_i15.p3  ORF type:complete len:322 (-),score=105.21 TRINITY_DN325_c0_g1_i15:1430-2395(-)
MDNLETKTTSSRFCCWVADNNPEEILGDDARTIKELFPSLFTGLNYSDDKEGSLCPAFMRSGSASFSFGQGELIIKPPLMLSMEQKEEDNLIPEPPVAKNQPPSETSESTQDNKPKSEKDELDGIFLKEKHNKKFTQEEDEKLKGLVKIHGEGAWSRIAENMEGRNRKQVRERYINFLKKDRVVTEFTPEEDALIIQYVQSKGRKWSLLSEILVGRPPIMIKNRYYAKLKKVIDKNKAKSDEGSNLSTSPADTLTGESVSPNAKLNSKENRKVSKESIKLEEEEDDIEKLKLQEKTMKAALVALRSKIEKLRAERAKNAAS